MRHLIKIALFLLAGVAAFLVYGFTALVAPQIIAILAAGSLVGTYIGLAFAEIPGQQRERARTVATAAMVIEAMYGTLYVLSVQYPAFFASPPIAVAIPLAMLHGASFSVLAFFVSLFVVHGQDATPSVDPATQLAQTLQIIADQTSAQTQVLTQRLSLPNVGATEVQPSAYPRQEVYPKPERVYACEECGATLNRHQYAAMKRRGRCGACPKDAL